MPLIFISYRRSDSRLVANRIYDRLVDAFGKQNVFKDVDNIPPGRDFRGVIREATSECRVMLVVIGPNWVNAVDVRGNRRLDDPGDFARIEVEVGLQRDNLVVIPLLVEGAPMPRPDQLPEALRELAYKNAFAIHDDPLFHHDMDILIRGLPIRTRPKWTFPLWLAILAAFLLIVVGLIALQPRLNQQTPTQTINFGATKKPTEIDTQVAAVVNSSEPSETLKMTITPSDTLEPSLTKPPTLSSTQIEQTVTADYAEILHEIQQTQNSLSTVTAESLTATANLWTDTPTSDARRTAIARVTLDAFATSTQVQVQLNATSAILNTQYILATATQLAFNATETQNVNVVATQAIRNLTATALAWTDTSSPTYFPTATWTPTATTEPSLTPQPTRSQNQIPVSPVTPIIFYGRIKNPVVVLSQPSLNGHTIYTLLDGRLVTIYAKIEGSTPQNRHSNLWYLISSPNNTQGEYIYSEFVELIPPTGEPNAKPPLITLTPTFG